MPQRIARPDREIKNNRTIIAHLLISCTRQVRGGRCRPVQHSPILFSSAAGSGASPALPRVLHGRYHAPIPPPLRVLHGQSHPPGVGTPCAFPVVQPRAPTQPPAPPWTGNHSSARSNPHSCSRQSTDSASTDEHFASRRPPGPVPSRTREFPCAAAGWCGRVSLAGKISRHDSTHERFFRGKTAKLSECEEVRPMVRAARARLRLAFFVRRLAVPPSESPSGDALFSSSPASPPDANTPDRPT